MMVRGTDLAIGLILGMAGGALHLAITWWRASMVTTRGTTLSAFFTYPLSFLGPAAAVLIAAKIAPAAAWITPLGLFGARFVGLRAASAKKDGPSSTTKGSKEASSP